VATRLSPWRRLLARLRRDRLDDDLRDEVELHIELRRRALEDEGMDPREAEYQARRMFGNVAAIREEARDMWGFPSLDTIAQDLRYGLRLLRRSPMFTAVSVLSLAVGIGAAAGVFSLADAVLLRKLPVKSPDELVVLQWMSGPVRPFQYLSGQSSGDDVQYSSTSFSLPTFEKLRTEAASYADIFGFAQLSGVNLSSDGRAEIGSAQLVSGNYFDVLGVPPASGRPLSAADDRPGAPPVALISDAYWQRRFARSADAVGRPLVVNGVTATIVGVTPRGFEGTLQIGDAPDVTLPLAMRGRLVPADADEAPDNPGFWWVLMMGRLKPGIDAARAAPALDLLMKQSVAASRPALKAAELPRLDLRPGARGQLEGREAMSAPLRTMGVVVAIVLLVACANVANLLLARGRARGREMAVRVAIGAPRSRVVRQLLTEGLLLAVISGTLGLLVSRWLAMALLPALGGWGRAHLEIPLEMPLDWRVGAFTALVAGMCSILFGLVPSLRATDVTLASGLQEGTRGAVGSARRVGLAGVLVVVQVALSMLLVTAAGLLVYSVRNLQRVDTGFDASNILLFTMDPSLNGYDNDRGRNLYAASLERLGAIPGVRSASFSSHALISGSGSGGIAALPGVAPPRPGPEAHAFFETYGTSRLVVDDHFHRTMGIPILSGRSFSPADSAQAPSVAIVNEALARQLFGEINVVGRQFKLGVGPTVPLTEVIGVCADAKYRSIRRPAPPTVYLTYRQRPAEEVTFALKTAGDPVGLVSAVREAIREIDPQVPLAGFRSQQQQILASLKRERLFARLATLLGAVTLLLSGIGLYALLAYAVTRRTQEIGVRMALGAERTTVRWMIVKQSLGLVGLGLILGIPAAVMGTRLVESMLFGLTPRDPATVAGAAVTMIAVSLAAAYVPARRASRVDPIVALRAE
jgi:predicted permease